MYFHTRVRSYDTYKYFLGTKVLSYFRTPKYCCSLASTEVRVQRCTPGSTVRVRVLHVYE